MSTLALRATPSKKSEAQGQSQSPGKTDYQKLAMIASELTGLCLKQRLLRYASSIPKLSAYYSHVIVSAEAAGVVSFAEHAPARPAARVCCV